VGQEKLERYLMPEVKKSLKSRFITGQSSEQVMKNLMNMSDSDEEDAKDKKKGKDKKGT